MIRRTIGAGTFFFTCLGRASGTIADCTGPICDGPDTWAASCAGSFRTHFCPLFWDSSPEEQAATIVHETSHNFATFIQDSGREGNAHCWERFVVVNGGGPENIVPHGADTCPEPAP